MAHVHEELVPIDVEQERVDAEQQVFPTTSSLDPIDLQVEDNIALNNEEDANQRHSQLALPQLPYFSMYNGLDYVLMSDVQHHFNICEDYYLAALAQYCEANKDFVENMCDECLLMDTDCDEAKYKSGRAILQSIFNEARAYEWNLPTSKEEFNAALHQSGLENMGKESSKPPNIDQGSSSSVALWKPNLLEDNENQLVCMVSIS